MLVTLTYEYRCEDFEETERLLNIVVNLSTPRTDPQETEIRNRAVNSMTRDEVDAVNIEGVHIRATLLPIMTVGVQGDCRSYSYVVALSTNARPIPWKMLYTYAGVIPKLFHKINRVAYVFGEQVEYPVHGVTVTHLVQPIIEKLQRADKAATDILFGRVKGQHGQKLPDVGRKVQQMPVVMIPVDFDRDETMPNSFKHSFVLRPFITSDFMTGIAAVPGVHIPEQTIFEMEAAIRQCVNTSRVLLDMTSKPPGTTEWE
ncbi:unnamed protein product [Caenorhabditis bovis]|uniref:GMP synthase C-terminal domain-containing protein n=1 Tax=Caenorhabditis bovis TaxID=2654633 RepID=A0A8S1ERY3_9PELO|nr:unnamed protein product [Caenorhabditis bovis]